MVNFKCPVVSYCSGSLFFFTWKNLFLLSTLKHGGTDGIKGLCILYLNIFIISMTKFLLPCTLIKNGMNYWRRFHIVFMLVLILFCTSCNNDKAEDEIKVVEPERMDVVVQQQIRKLLTKTDIDRSKKIDDSTKVFFLPVLQYYYSSTKYEPVWSSQENWKPHTDSLIQYLSVAAEDGLFAEDYQFTILKSLKQSLDADSLKRKDARLWVKADLLLSDAFFHIIQDLKQGRLQHDSLAWKNNAAKQEKFFSATLIKLLSGDSVSSIVKRLQPSNKDYVLLKKNIPSFLSSMDTGNYTYLNYPYKDSLFFLKKLLKRLRESGFKTSTSASPDSVSLSRLLIQYQKENGFKTTGQLSAGMVSKLNNTDKEKLKRIAITLDRYKQLPVQLPEKFIWVNLPSYKLKVWDRDSLMMESKVIIGKTNTPTPHIISQVSDLVIYPTWTVPNSIIMKEMLPGLKKSPGYLARKGLGLFSNNGDEVDPWSINWAKYKKGIPYFVRQGSGDNNALGVIKFNFKNPYSVYLHDTNQRYLFKNSIRSFSHGCVRVQDWQKLAFYLVRNDSLLSRQPDSLKYNTDSIMSWIAQKEKHTIQIKKQIPIFILYFGCEAAKESIIFFDDIYAEDKVLREKYFALK